MRAGISLSILLLALGPQEPSTLQAGGDSAEEIVVTGSRSRSPPDFVAIFREHCFDANRRIGRAAFPSAGSGWQPLEPETMRARNISDPRVAAFEKTDFGFNVAMMIEIEDRPYHRTLIQHRCSLKTYGLLDPPKLTGGISRMFGGAGTQTHVTHDIEEGALPGWSQWRWTGAVVPTSEQWRVYRSGGFLQVVQDSFYAGMSYVVVDLKFSDDAKRPASVITLVHIFDPRVFCRPASRRNSAGCAADRLASAARRSPPPPLP